jgi:hypothetical protein
MTTPLSQVLERINQVFWICSADLSETLYVSPAYEEIWGRPIQDLYSHPESFTSPICPEDRAGRARAELIIRKGNTKGKLATRAMPVIKDLI